MMVVNLRISILLIVLGVIVIFCVERRLQSSAGTARLNSEASAMPARSTRSGDGNRLTQQMIEVESEITSRVKIYLELPAEKKSQYRHTLGRELVRRLEQFGNYDLIERVLELLDANDIEKIFRYEIMGAHSGRGVDFDLQSQLRIVRQWVSDEESYRSNLLKVFGERRGQEGIASNFFKALSASEQCGLMEGMASSGYSVGLIQNLRDVADDEYRAQIFEHSISVAIKKSPEDTVLEIGKLPASPYRDELLAVMIASLVKVGAGEEAKDWIGEIGDQTIRGVTQKLLDR